MDAKLKVTDVPEEASFYDLVAGDNVLEIPLFQRPYKWKESHYKVVLQDISGIDEETRAESVQVVSRTWSLAGSYPQALK